MSWVKGYKLPFSIIPSRTDNPSVYPRSEQERINFDVSIDKLLKINAISQCGPVDGQFLSSIFLVPKPNGSNRFILNLKCLNKFIKTQHFKMEDYRTASKLLTKNCYMASIDLKDSYFFIPVHKSHRKYLRFRYNDVIYEFNCLPFGLCTAPYVFTKLMKPILEFLRSRGMISVMYLDDILCIGRDYSECVDIVQHTKELLESLGFILNMEKSCLVPKTSCTFLGFVFDSEKMTLTLPKHKKTKIKERLLVFKNTRRCKLREFARLIGLLISSCPALQYSWLYTKNFERHKYLCLLNNHSYEQIINLPYTLKDDINWWLDNIDHGYFPLSVSQYELEIFSDASTTGWGAYCNKQKCFGYWKDDEKSSHINELELKSAFLALKCFAKEMFDCKILLRIDNVTAISCINRMGSVQYSHFNKLSRQLWEWCEKRKIIVFASYINTKENNNADALSRKKFQDTEWELNKYAFDEITNKFGIPEIDLFASRCNAKCKIYVTWKNDPDALTIDAFTIPWQKTKFYAFPPFSLIVKVLQKIVNDNAEGIVVIPYWPTQPWFPLFQKLTVSEVLYFEPDTNLLLSPFRMNHSLHKTLRLAAAKLSGKLY